MKCRILFLSLAMTFPSAGVMAADKQPQPTDPMSSSRAPDPKPKSGNSTFDAPDKPAGPWGEVPGGGGPSGYNDGSGQKSPQYEGEQFKTAEQSERDATSKAGGKQAPEAAKRTTPVQPSPPRQQQVPLTDVMPDEVAKRHHETNSPPHLGPQGGSTADSGKAKADEEARLERDAAKSQGNY